MMLGSGGNLAVSAGADGVFLVDDQFAPLTPKIRAACPTREFDQKWGRGFIGPERFVRTVYRSLAADAKPPL